MNPINTIKERVKKYPNLQIVEGPGSITIKAESEDGFDVSFEEKKDEYIVYFEGWHEHFKKAEIENALNCFALGLSDSCRIKEFSKKGKPYRWDLEYLKNGKWYSDSTMGLFKFGFRIKPEIRYFQNKLISETDS
jgi:hypothetical protein